MTLFFARIAAVLCLQVALISTATAAPTDPNFAVDLIQSGNGKTKIAFDAAGRMYVTEKQGRVLLFNPDGSGGFQAPAVLLDLTASVDPSLEAGLLGFEIDPDHANNRFIYLFYSTATDQRLVRYTMNVAFNAVEGGSEVILLSGLPRDATFHKAGDIGIHPLDPFAIYVMLGDDGQIWPDNTLPQNIDSYVGKILRVDSSTGLGLSDNPYYSGDTSAIRSRVWASGFRNQFRFVFHPTRTDLLYISENGDATDRVALVKAGGNGLWNGNDAGGFLTVNDPLFKVLYTGGPSHIGIEIVTSGPFADNGEPTLYLGEWFPNPNGIRRFTLSDSSDPQGDEWDTLTPIAGGGSNWWEQFAIGVDLQLGPDGHLYHTETNGGAAQAGWYQLRRYRFAGGSPPSAAFATNPASGRGEAPFEVTFADSSTVGTASLSSWHWDFGDGNTSTLQNPTHTYTAPGAYTFTLTVTDNVGLSDFAQGTIAATTSTPVALAVDVQDGRVLPAVPATYACTISFYQIDGVTPLTFAGGSGPEGNQVVTLADGTYSASLALPLIGPGFVMVLEALSPPGFQTLARGVTVDPGQASSVSETFFVSTSALSGRVVSHRGDPAVIDVGVSSGGLPVAFAGARDYRVGSAFPPTGVFHRVTVDSLGYFSLPIPSAEVGATVSLTFAEDTGRGTYATSALSVTTVANTNVDASFTIGEWRGGPADDLSGQAYAPGVAYSAIQSIFSANCIGCHRANTTNNGGLDLTSGNSFSELVDQPSLFVPGLKLVDPGNPSRSYLFEKINSDAPQQGARMRPMDPMPLADQALIRDWIAQLAPSYENYLWTTFGAAPGSAGTAVDEDFDSNGTVNGLDYTNPGFGSLAMSPGGATFQGELTINADVLGLTLVIMASDDLESGTWRTVASRIRGQSAWLVAPGFSVLETSPGVLQFFDTTAGVGSRFYRFGAGEE